MALLRSLGAVTETQIATPGDTRDCDGRHIVDVLIEERAPRLMQRPLLWRFVKTFLMPVFGYNVAIDVIDRVQSMSGREIFEYLIDELDMQVHTDGLAHVPKTGATVLMPNHPAGIADGVALYQALREVREDAIFFANRDAVRAAPTLSDMIIPVEWVEERRDHARNKETVRAMIRAFKDEKVVVIFPSGRLARPTIRGLVEREWMASGVSLAVKYDCPVVPVHIKGYNSWLYYLFWFLSDELRDMTLFRELFNKHGQEYTITCAAPTHLKGDPAELAVTLREFVTQGIPSGERHFQPTE